VPAASAPSATAASARAALLRDAYCDEAAGIAGAYQLFVPGALDEAWYAGTLCVLHANLVKVRF
jgi:hypothetical protein